MSEIKDKLIQEARQRYEVIKPCAMYNSLEECFTVEKGKILFWFNSEDSSTHVAQRVLFSS